jgi:hypothetical protein
MHRLYELLNHAVPMNLTALFPTARRRAVMLSLTLAALLVSTSCSNSVPRKFTVTTSDGTQERLTMTEVIERASESSQHFVLGKATKAYFRITHVKFRLKYELSYNWNGEDDGYYEKVLISDSAEPSAIKTAMNKGIREVLKESLARTPS